MYVSEGLFGSAETNPLIITFAIQSFSVFVADRNFSQNFIVSDDVGDSQTLLIPSLDGMTFRLRGSGITMVEIASSEAFWSFAIDDVSFTSTTSIPEPTTLAMLGTSLVLLLRAYSLRAAALRRLYRLE
jgi:hypothetical protein